MIKGWFKENKKEISWWTSAVLVLAAVWSVAGWQAYGFVTRAMEVNMIIDITEKAEVVFRQSPVF